MTDRNSGIGQLGRTLAAKIAELREDIHHQGILLQSMDLAMTAICHELQTRRPKPKQSEEVWSPSDITGG